MKKFILLLLCLVFVLAGCAQMDKAESYYTDTMEGVTFKTAYKYYFDDESNILCTWVNESDKNIKFQDPFELHILKDGEWYKVTDGAEPAFNTSYCHGVDAKTEGNNRYEVSVYTDKLKDGETYRISTYYYDDDDNYFQAFAEFTCDNKLAEEEIEEISDGAVSHRKDPSDTPLEVTVTN